MARTSSRPANAPRRTSRPGVRISRSGAVGRILAGVVLGSLMLAALGPGRGWLQIVTATVRTRCAGALRAVVLSVHSCCFYVGQSAGPIAHGFARLHPEKVPGLLAGAAIIVAVACAYSRWWKGQRAPLSGDKSGSSNKCDVIA